MQEPFPELTHLELLLNENEKLVAVLSDSFLGGSAPCLEALDFDRIPFPGSISGIAETNFVSHSPRPSFPS